MKHAIREDNLPGNTTNRFTNCFLFLKFASYIKITRDFDEASNFMLDFITSNLWIAEDEHKE